MPIGCLYLMFNVFSVLCLCVGSVCVYIAI